MENPLSPIVVEPFSSGQMEDLRRHVTELRRAFDAPGARYHDADHPDCDRFNRWYFHNLPLLVALHHSPRLIQSACDLFCEDVKPSYAFLSMYGSDGVCPPHKDRPQCRFTIDLQISSDGVWPLYVDEKPYHLTDGKALAYSGTQQLHYRNSMRETTCTFMNLAFFHFVPADWMGVLS